MKSQVSPSWDRKADECCSKPAGGSEGKDPFFKAIGKRLQGKCGGGMPEKKTQGRRGVELRKRKKGKRGGDHRKKPERIGAGASGSTLPFLPDRHRSRGKKSGWKRRP